MEIYQSKVAVLDLGPADARPSILAKKLGLDLVSGGEESYGDNYDYMLGYEQEGLTLTSLDKGCPGFLRVNFSEKSLSWRLKHSGKKQAIAKAVGMKSGHSPTIIDATAGLGKDGFILAFLGCKVHLIERSPILHALLDDGLQRTRKDENNALREAANRISLSQADSMECLDNLPKAQVIYLDPMFPAKKKSAKVKKNMQLLQNFLQENKSLPVNHSAPGLLQLSISSAIARVVVKRPRHAGFLEDQKSDFQLIGKSNRFDIYLSPTSTKK